LKLHWIGPLPAAVLLSLTCAVGAGCVAGGETRTPRDRFGLSVFDDSLVMGPRPFLLRAVEKPEMGDPGLTLEDKVRTLNLLAGAGINGVVLPLDDGVCAGGGIDAEWVKAFGELTEETRRREMSVVLRMEPRCSRPEAFGPAEAAAVGAALAESWDVLFWFPQAEPGPYLEAFRRATDRFVTAADGPTASVLVIEGPVETSDSRPIVLSGADAEAPAPGRHLIFREPPGMYLRPDSGRPDVDPLPLRGRAAELLSSREVEEGFVPLFDGRSLTGWTVTGNPRGWAVEEGEIVWKGRGGGYVRTVGEFGDFILRLEWRIVRGGNSGVFIRFPRAGRASRIGMEIQILGDSGSPPHKNGTGAVYDVVAPLVNAARPEGEWNQFEIHCRGPLLKVRLNERLIQDVNLDADPELRPRLRRGFIALQDHGHPVAFRNIRILPLDGTTDPDEG
jgi:hypothetical protein